MSSDTNPFRSLERQFERMQRQFEEALDMWNMDQFGTATDSVSTMGIDLADHGDEFTLTADVPGFETDDIELRLSDNTVHITAEHEQEAETEADDEASEGFYIKSERARRSLSRSVRVPEPIDEDGVEATYRNGVLSITLPKAKPTEPQGETIDIE